MFRFEIAADYRLLWQDAAVWNSLAGAAPFRQTHWLASWWDHFGDCFQPYCVVARDSAGTIRGLLPLYRSANARGVLRFVGDGEACSDGLSILCRDEDADCLGEELGAWLSVMAAHREWGWSLLDLDGIVAGDLAMIAFSRGLAGSGAATHAQSRMHTWFKPTTGTWDQYLASLKNKHRRQTRQTDERIDQTPGLQRRLATDEASVRTDLDAMIELHQQRWNDAGEPGTYANPRFREFIHAAAGAFWRAGKLRMASLAIDGKMIAGELHLIGGDGAISLYSTGVDRAHGDLGPGRMMNIETMKYAHANSLPGIDFLRGDERYKSTLLAQPKRLIRLRVVPNSAWSRAQHAAWKTGFEIKQWVRRKRGSEPIVVLPGLELTNFAQCHDANDCPRGFVVML